jgi:hypothetical protein
VDPRVVLVMGYMAEFRFHNPIYNSAPSCPLHVFMNIDRGIVFHLILFDYCKTSEA